MTSQVSRIDDLVDVCELSCEICALVYSFIVYGSTKNWIEHYKFRPVVYIDNHIISSSSSSSSSIVVVVVVLYI